MIKTWSAQGHGCSRVVAWYPALADGTFLVPGDSNCESSESKVTIAQTLHSNNSIRVHAALLVLTCPSVMHSANITQTAWRTPHAAPCWSAR